MPKRLTLAALLAVLAVPLIAACGDDDETLTVYSGRGESLVQPIIDRFEEAEGVEVDVQYGGTAELAATILEEGDNTPADVYFAQDAGALGALQAEGRLAVLPDDILERVDPALRSPDGRWVGLSGRARVVVYNTEMLSPEDLPDSILDFTDPEWSGRIGWAPTNGSFQAFVTGLRVSLGDEAALEWLEGILANDVREYPNNTTIVEAAANGEIEAGFVNHYYLYRFLAEAGDSFGARNYHFPGDDIGNLINVAGAGIIDGTDDEDLAVRFLEFMLSEEAQQYFADETFEYPLIEGVETHSDLPPLDSIGLPELDLGNLDDLQGTIELLQEAGALP